MVVDRVFFDTNVLVYASLRQSPLHGKAVQAIHSQVQAGSEMWVSRQVLREYLSWRTRQSTATLASAVVSAVSDIVAFERMFHVADETFAVTAALRTLIANIPTGGKQIHDANLVATMEVLGISRLVTHNVKDFTRFGSLITIIPIDP